VDATTGRPQGATETVDVLIVGAGISGLGAAHHLKAQCPGRSFAILDAQGSFGGTWRTHTYPGIRSDSDMYTFGYRFKPWMDKPIATADNILNYLQEVIRDDQLGPHIRYGHTVDSASWDSQARLWTVKGRRKLNGQANDGSEGEPFTLQANFLWMCQGYYRHSQGYTPQWPGMDQFQGRVVHPQTWPQDLDVGGKQVLVIGSGATAATLVPALAGKAAHVTMLQRSPTYFVARPNVNELATLLKDLDVPPEWTHEIVRRSILKFQRQVVNASRHYPEAVKKELLDGVRKYLNDEQVAEHFTPSYRPWRQRIAFVPDGDLFAAVQRGEASVVTDHIEAFDATGVRLKSGRHLAADIVVTATGFNLNTLGDIAFSIDGRPLQLDQCVTWRGALFTGVPNLCWIFGYLRASWTLRVDLIGDLVCRLLQHMQDKGARMVVPALRPGEEDMPRLPWIDPEDFNPGYMQRNTNQSPVQGDRAPWQYSQDYWSEAETLPKADLEDGSLRYA
jgi:cation diffusion facilitator CzcD-associated flavoprotein CzcO